MCIQELRKENVSSQRLLASTVSSNIIKHHSLLISLSDATQQFHDTCVIYAENISPHSKFRFRFVIKKNFFNFRNQFFRELLNRMEILIRQLRSCAAATNQQQKSLFLKNKTTSSVEDLKILSETEQSVRQIMQLINR